ncbi:MAG: hypothetical protein M1812_004628 [Candelaria pacifica]|nr:MAG: hypothetical protein M1812_004628 [Candelaria pacifica]
MTEWAKKKYNDNYDYYMPWVEDKYLQWFGENKTSYTTKGTIFPPLVLTPSILAFHHKRLAPSHSRSLVFPVFTTPIVCYTLPYLNANPTGPTENLKKTEITGNKDINNIQDSVAEGVGNQFGKGGIGEGIGNTLSKEGFNRAEGEEQDSDKLAKDKAGKASGGGLGGMLGGSK